MMQQTITKEKSRIFRDLNSEDSLVKEVTVLGGNNEFDISLVKISDTDKESIFKIVFESANPSVPESVTIRWTLPAIGIKGVWTTNSLYEKRIRADWEESYLQSSISVDAPVTSIFGRNDENIQTFACLDSQNTVDLKASLREEDNLVYCEVTFFTEPIAPINYYETEIYIYQNKIHYAKALNAVANWWSSHNIKEEYTPIPKAAYNPVYSTWYSYHQDLSVEKLLKECELAASMGYKTIIIDDGWQTMDTNRGYDFTGDWLPERITNMKEFADKVHQMGMKIMVWYSVPFCGVKSKAYQRFKGKFLTENHRWAPVFDPRYAEIRSYLVNIYAKAINDWGIDGLKLDFIDDFKVYPETDLSFSKERDFQSVNGAVDQLMNDVKTKLFEIDPEILIEFRQKYIGPNLQKYGNMFRAFDCPNDSITNRIRTTDVRLLCNQGVVHSDMLEWHYEETVEIAALQFLNIMFSVPQISVRLEEVPEDHLRMISFYTKYWIDHRELLMGGDFIPLKPMANYPILKAKRNDQMVVGVYEDMVVEVEDKIQKIDIINGKSSDYIIFKVNEPNAWQIECFDCLGELKKSSNESLNEGIVTIEVAPSGLIKMQKI